MTPLLGRAFTRTETIDINTETVVLLTARIVHEDPIVVRPDKTRETLEAERELTESREERDRRIFPVNPITEDLGGMPFGGYEPTPASAGDPPPAEAETTP